MDARAARAARALIAAVGSTGVAALFHVAGGGAPPGAVTLALATALASLVCIALSSARLSLWRLSVSVAVSQAAFHGLFAITGSAALVTPAHGGHDAHGAVTGTLETFAPVHGPMGVAHLLAAAVTVAALARGEQILVSLLVLAGIRLSFVALPASAPVRRSPRAAHRHAPARDRRDSLGVLRHRGPPLAV